MGIVPDPKTMFSKKLDSIKKQLGENYKQMITGIPTAFILIPLVIFLLNPSESQGIFMFGVVFTSIVALIFTPNEGSNFLKNKPSFHGLALGYLVGWFLMDNIQKSKLGSMLSAIVFGLLLVIILTASLDSEHVWKLLLKIGIGFLLGIFIGMFFSFCNHQLKDIKENEENKKE
jgi:hypothetical protein